MKLIPRIKYISVVLLMFLIAACSSVCPEVTGTTYIKEYPVVLYSASWCHWCGVAKEFLDDNEIAYIERNLEDPKEYKKLKEVAKELQYGGSLNVVPIFIVRNRIITGFRPEKILYILDKTNGVVKKLTNHESPRSIIFK